MAVTWAPSDYLIPDRLTSVDDIQQIALDYVSGPIGQPRPTGAARRPIGMRRRYVE